MLITLPGRNPDNATVPNHLPCLTCCRRMDWILQKDGEKKEARKRKKAAKGTVAASATAGAMQHQSSTAATTSTGTAAADPAAAAAALQAFGAVVDLCTQPGCRRARLLKHFGEELPTPQPSTGHSTSTSSRQDSRLGSKSSSSSATATAAASKAAVAVAVAVGSSPVRCCDYCDSPGVVSALAQQLKEKESELLQRYMGRGGYRGKRQRGCDGGGMFGVVGAGSGSEDEEGSGKDIRFFLFCIPGHY